MRSTTYVSIAPVASQEITDVYGNKVFPDLHHQLGTLVVVKEHPGSLEHPYHYVFVNDRGGVTTEHHAWGPSGDLEMESR